MRYHKLKSVLLAFILVFFFGPLGLFYAGAGWGFLAIFFTFIFMTIGCGVGVFLGDPGGWWITLDVISLPVIVFGVALGYSMMHLVSLIVGPVIVHHRRQNQLDELGELEAFESRAANRYRPKRRRYSYT